MEKIVNINKAPKDDVLNKIMQEIDDENLSAETSIPPKKKKSKKKKTPPQQTSWTRWIVNFIFLAMTAVFLFVLVLIFQATEEITTQETMHVSTTDNNHSVMKEENLSKVTTPLRTEIKDKKVPDNLIIFDMKYKKTTPVIEQAPGIPLKEVKKIEKPLTEREKAKALLKEQMSF